MILIYFSFFRDSRTRLNGLRHWRGDRPPHPVCPHGHRSPLRIQEAEDVL